MDGFGQVLDLDVGAAGEVGAGAGHFEDAVVGAGGELEFFHGGFEQGGAGRVEVADLAHQAAGHLGVGVDAGQVFEALGLDVAGLHDPLGYFGAAFGGALAGGEFVVADGGDLHVQVDAVEQGTGDLAQVALDHAGCAHAVFVGVVMESARTGLRG